MKTKQIYAVFLLPMMILGSVVSTLLLPAESVSALTKEECFDKYVKKSFNFTTENELKKFKQAFDKTKCAKGQGGTCTYKRGAAATASKPFVVVTVECEKPANNNYTGPGDDAPGECGGVETAIIRCDAKNSGDVEDNGIWALLLLVINIMTAGVGVLAIAGIVYGSILYTTAEDKADQVKKATDIITNVVIGLVAFALMWAGLNFIIPGGVFL